MHYKAVTLFGLCVPMAGFLFWIVALVAWPLAGRERGWVPTSCAVLIAAAGCWILAGSAGQLWYAGLASSPLVFGAASLITPAGRHHRQDRPENDSAAAAAPRED